MLARSNKGTWLPVLLSLGVKGVRVNSKRSTCEKIQQSIWIFHSKFRQAFFIFNFSFLIHPVIGW